MFRFVQRTTKHCTHEFLEARLLRDNRPGNVSLVDFGALANQYGPENTKRMVLRLNPDLINTLEPSRQRSLTAAIRSSSSYSTTALPSLFI